MKFVDLFAGWGGMRQAAEEVGWECMGSWENDPDIASCYQAVWGDLPHEDVRDISELPDGCEAILAGFPCQSFSSLGKKKGFLDQTRGTLIHEVLRLAAQGQPRVVVLENVKNLVLHDNGDTFRTIRGALRDDLGYHASYAVLDAKDFGCACKRPRIFIVSFRDRRDLDEFSFYPLGWRPLKPSGIASCLSPPREVPESAWLTQVALDGLKKHRQRHKEKGHGWGYVVLDPQKPANTFSTSGNGSEHNLIVDKRDGTRGSDRNSDGLRVLLPEERARAMGFPDKFVFPLSRDLGNTVVGNSVAVPVVTHILGRINEVLA